MAQICEIYISPQAKTLPFPVDEIKAIKDSGLEGDRYALGIGSFSHYPGKGRHVTFIEQEVITQIAQDIPFSAAESRRNIVTQGIHLNELIDCEFQIGTALFRGIRPCEPCALLEQRTRKGILKALLHKGGLRADIIQSGIIKTFDEIRFL